MKLAEGQGRKVLCLKSRFRAARVKKTVVGRQCFAFPISST